MSGFASPPRRSRAGHVADSTELSPVRVAAGTTGHGRSVHDNPVTSRISPGFLAFPTWVPLSET